MLGNFIKNGWHILLILFICSISACIEIEGTDPIKDPPIEEEEPKKVEHYEVSSISGTLFTECGEVIKSTIVMEVLDPIHDYIYDTISSNENGEFNFYKIDTFVNLQGATISPAPLKFRSLSDTFDFIVWKYIEYEDLKVHRRDSLELFVHINLEKDIDPKEYTLSLHYTPQPYLYKDYFKIDVPLLDAIENGVYIPRTKLDVLSFDMEGNLMIYLFQDLIKNGSGTGGPQLILDKEACIMELDTVFATI